jgi:hypothetical protein
MPCQLANTENSILRSCFVTEWWPHSFVALFCETSTNEPRSQGEIGITETQGKWPPYAATDVPTAMSIMQSLFIFFETRSS